MCFSKNGTEHVADLERFFERLTIFNLKLAPKKAYIGVRVIKFLGHRVTAKGVEPDPEKVEAMTKLPMPSNVSQLRSLLGALSYYRKFLPLCGGRCWRAAEECPCSPPDATGDGAMQLRAI